MTSDKMIPNKVFCLFHQKIDCLCIHPVADKEALRSRLEQSARLHEFNNKYETDEEVKARQTSEIENFRRRLSEME